MIKLLKFSKVPNNSMILKDFGEVHYCDSFKINKSIDHDIDSILNQVIKMPRWITILMKIRNSIVGPFGLKTDGYESQIAKYYPVGSRAKIFTVIERNETEIVMGENDKHLQFRLSVLVNKYAQESEIYLTTVVKFNNIWGRLYFLPVKPFHILIIRSLLKNIQQ